MPKTAAQIRAEQSQRRAQMAESPPTRPHEPNPEEDSTSIESNEVSAQIAGLSGILAMKLIGGNVQHVGELLGLSAEAIRQILRELSETYPD